jgi:hypothetical protein
MYPHVTQFQTTDNRRRRLLAAEPEPKAPSAKRRRLLFRVPRVTSQPCR